MCQQPQKNLPQRTKSDITKNKELFPPTAVTSQGPNEHFRISLGWRPLPLESVIVCHLLKKAQLASSHCTNAGDNEVSALWIQFQQRRSYVVWGFKQLQYQMGVTALLSGLLTCCKNCQEQAGSSVEQGFSQRRSQLRLVSGSGAPRQGRVSWLGWMATQKEQQVTIQWGGETWIPKDFPVSFFQKMITGA